MWYQISHASPGWCSFRFKSYMPIVSLVLRWAHMKSCAIYCFLFYIFILNRRLDFV